MKTLRRRRMILGLVLIAAAIAIALLSPSNYQPKSQPDPARSDDNLAITALAQLAVRGRAPKTGYQRSQFGDGWTRLGICDTRNRILYRDLQAPTVDNQCRVVSGILNDPYTGQRINFVRGQHTSQAVQIDHVVALSDAWQKGAQNMSFDQRVTFANDPLVLLAVDGQANNEKGSGDAATWLPPNKFFRCRYVARQIAIKQKYQLWVTQAEADAMRRVLSICPGELLPKP